MTEGIPPAVRDFVLAHVDSIELLEVLLILAARPEVEFTADTVADQLRTAPTSARNRLRHLRDHHLAKELPNGTFRLQRGAELETIVSELAQVYLQRRVAMITLIYSRPSDVVRVFTDAFVLKKGPKDG
jgi:hypothetical protein